MQVMLLRSRLGSMISGLFLFLCSCLTDFSWPKGAQYLHAWLKKNAEVIAMLFE